MGGGRADDVYTFGDFAFASFPLSSTVHSHYVTQINDPGVASSSGNDFDDDWSDFVKSPIQSGYQTPNAAPENTQSKPIDPFVFFPNGDVNKSGSTQKGEIGLNLVKKKGDWEKPKGPLPLSLFGDVEEEEEAEENVEEGKRSGLNDPLGGYGKDSSASSRMVVNVSNSVPVHDVIGNLYDYNTNDQIKAGENGGFPKSLKFDAEVVDLNKEDSILGSNLSSSSVVVKKDLDDNDQIVKDGDKSKFNLNGLVPNPNADALGLDKTDWSVNFSSSSPIGSSGWGLNISSSTTILNGQSEPSKGENFGSNVSRLGPDQNTIGSSNLGASSSPAFGGWGFDFGGSTSASNKFDANANLTTSSSSFNGLSLNSRNEELDANGREDDGDGDDDGWEFQGAVSGANVTEGVSKADPGTHKMSDINTQSSGFGGGSNGSVDLFAFSDGSVGLFSMLNGVWGDSGRVGTDNSKPAEASQNIFNSHKAYGIEQTGDVSGVVSHPLAGAPENDEDFKEFTAAFPVNELVKEVNDAAKLHDVAQLNACAPSFGNQSSRPVDLFALSTESIDFSGMSNGVSSAPLEFGIGFNTIPSTTAQSAALLNKEPVDNKDGLDPHPVVKGGESDEDFGEFTTSFPEAAERQQEWGFSSDHPKSDLRETAFDGKGERIEMDENKRGALPLSIFGDQDLEVDETLNGQSIFLHSPSPVHRNGHSAVKVTSISDIISNLYAQAEQNSSVDILNDTTDVEVRPAEGVNSDLLDDADDVSWEFKDAFAGAAAENEKSDAGPKDAPWCSPSPVDANESNQSNGRMEDYVEFYSELKDGLSFVMKSHLETLKEARNFASLSGEDDKVMALDGEIQEFYKLLDQETAILQGDSSLGHLSGDSSLKKLLEALQEKFQILEAEYGLSQRLLVAEKDMRSALDLRKHAIAMLKALRFGSAEDHLMYISTWSKMISVCFQELQSGANIWKQSLQRNVHLELLAEPEGKKFLQALGEIYRVTMVLGASARLYKPWTLESCAESPNIYSLLDECTRFWSASGLEEALLHSTCTNENSAHAALVESIQYIRNLDLVALQDHAFTRQQSRCRLSLLTPETILGMKVVAWNGERYFVKLANLWANLISSDPQRMPHLHASVGEEKVG